MKNILNYILSFALLLAFSCSDDFLDLQPEQSVADTEALTSLQDLQSSVTGVYNDLSNSDYYGRYFILIPDVMSDDVKQNSQANRVKDYAEYVVSVADNDARNIWTLMYRAANAANAIINSEIDVASSVVPERDHIIGEAHALRALIYFDIVRLYAQHYTFTADASHLGVPIVLTSDPESKPSRNSVQDVYDQVLSDLADALSLMQDDSRSGNSSTLSKSAVRAIMARVYLNMEDWANAESMAGQVIADNAYSLVPNANYMDLWQNDNTSESIFEIANTDADNAGFNALGGMYIGEGFGDYLPSDDVVSLYDPGDVRLGVFYVDPFLSGDYAPYRMGKYRDPLYFDNIKVIRLAEMYLIRAEARARIGTDIAGAQDDFDVVHQRGLPGAADLALTGSALLDAIATERRRELCYEGHRLWDLMRYKEDVVRNQCTSNICLIEYGSDRVILPIPQLETDANPNIEPNPGFQ